MPLHKTLARIIALGALATVAACAVQPGDYAYYPGYAPGYDYPGYAPGYGYPGYGGYPPGFYGSTLGFAFEGERDHRRDRDRDDRHDGDEHRGGDRTSAPAGHPAAAAAPAGHPGAAPHPITQAGSRAGGGAPPHGGNAPHAGGAGHGGNGNSGRQHD
jgi:hypothetical protein